MMNKETDMNKRSYDRSESISIDGKPFHFTPDRKEFLDALQKKYPNQTSFTKEDFDNLGHFPYWVKHTRYNFKQGSVFNLQPILKPVPDTPVSSPAPVVNVQPTAVPAQQQVSNMPVAACD